MTRTTLFTALGSAVIGGLAVGYLTVGPMAMSVGTSGVAAQITDTTIADSGVATDPDVPPVDPAATDTAADDSTRDERFAEHIETALAPLVADGTLTDAELQRIVDALAAARPDRPNVPHRPGPRVRAGFRLGEVTQLVADTIGITPDQLRTELKDQGTIGAVATAHGVDPQAVIDALVAQGTAKIDAKVASGDLTAERAAEMKAHLVERSTNLVNNTPHPREGD